MQLSNCERLKDPIVLGIEICHAEFCMMNMQTYGLGHLNQLIPTQIMQTSAKNSSIGKIS